MKIGQKMTVLGSLLIGLTTVSILGILFWQSSIVAEKLGGYFEEQARHEVELAVEDAGNLLKTQHATLSKQLENDMHVLLDLVKRDGGIRVMDETVDWNAVNQVSKESSVAMLPKLKVGYDWLGQNANPNVPTPLVDSLMNLTGTTCTVFQTMNPQGDLLRVATNILKTNGKRAVGTYIPSSSPVAKTVKSGQTFRGTAYVVNAWYLTQYRPFRDDQGNVLGCLYVGLLQEGVEQLRDGLKSVKLGSTGSLTVLGGSGKSAGIIKMHKSADREGKNIFDVKDAEGNAVYSELVKAAKEADGKPVTQVVLLDESGSGQPQETILTAVYFKPWDWVILGTGYLEEFMKGKHAADEALASSRNWTAGIGVGMLVLGVVLILLFARQISGHIGKVVDVLSSINKGELDVEPLKVPAGGPRDELDVLGQALNSTVETLRHNIEEITEKTEEAHEKAEAAEKAMAEADVARAEAESARREGIIQAAQHIQGVVDRVSAASSQIATQSEIIGKGTSIQRDRVQETATAMEEMNATVLEVARNASEASSMGMEAKELAVEGAGIVSKSVEAMNTTFDAAKELKTGMNKLEEQADDIGKVMEVITDIADQTNLLALNAAIEAARAGEAGRGFAVVADEVRKLAEKTMQATTEVGNSITAVQDVAQQNITGMDKALSDLGVAVDMSSKSGTVLNEIVEGAELSAEQIQGIATAAEQQSATSEEINRAIEEINSVSTETSQGVEESADALREMEVQMAELQKVIDTLMQDAEA